MRLKQVNPDSAVGVQAQRARIPRAITLPALCILPCLNGIAAAAAPEVDLETIDVIATGETRQVLRLGEADLETLPGGTSALKALERLPGVNFQSADPFGANEWSTRLTVRGFAQGQLGYTLDGIPLGDMSYANHNGLHASRAIAAEDLREVRLAQGAGALGTASTSNLGGTVEFYSLDPEPDSGGQVDLTVGSDGARRLRGRFDTGLLEAGTSLFLSGVDQRTSKWRGAGNQKQQNLTFKLRQELATARITAFFNHSDRVDIDYQDLSLDLISRRGYYWDNWTPDWAGAVQAARQCAASGYGDGQACDDAYWNSSTLRRDSLAYLGVEVPLGTRAGLELKVYAHDNRGQGLWATPYTPTPGGAPLSIRITDFDMDRRGFVSRGSWSSDDHRLQAGLWYENNRFGQTRMFVGEPSASNPTRSFYHFQRDPFFIQWQYEFRTRTLHAYFQDEWQARPALRLTYGAKLVDVRNAVRTVSGPVKQGRIGVHNALLPQAGALWQFRENHELFASYSRNVRAFVSAAFAGPFGTSADGFEAIRDTLKPERSTIWETGWRFRTPKLYGSTALYRVSYRNRLLNIQPGPIILGNPSILTNVGSAGSRGAELALGVKPLRGVAWFSSVTVNDSRFNDDYMTDGRVVAVRGRRLPDAPRFVLHSELSFDTGTAWLKVSASHVGRRYYTYLNDGSAPAYSLLNVGLGLRLASPRRAPAFEELSLQLDVRNLADKRYIATVGSTDFVESDPGGTRQTLLNGAPRQYFVTLRSRF